MTRYCGTCGAAMWHIGTEITGYDEFTGKPWFTKRFKCPNNRIWRVGHGSITITTNPRYKEHLGED